MIHDSHHLIAFNDIAIVLNGGWYLADNEQPHKFVQAICDAVAATAGVRGY